MKAKALIFTTALTASMIAVNINAFSQSGGVRKLEISTLTGEEFSYMLSGVSRIAVRGSYADIISQNGECLFTFPLYENIRQTVVFVSADQENDSADRENDSADQENDSADQEITSADDLKNPETQAVIFPNPSTGSISIRGAGENPLVRVISAKGAVIMTMQGTEADISRLTPGTYIITVNNQAFKILKQ